MLPERAFTKKLLGNSPATLEGGGGGQPAQAAPAQPTTTTVQNTSIPEYAQPYVESMLGATQQQLFNMNGNTITGIKPYTPYSTNPSDYIAPFSPMQQQSQSAAANLQTPGQYGQATQAATQGVGQALGAGQNYAQQATDPNAISAYMNPYIQNTLAPALALQNQQFGQIAAQNAGQATQAGAFGGGRDAVVQGLNQQNQMLAQNQLVGNAYNAAFGQAQQAQQYGAGLGLQGAQAGIQGAGQLANIGGQQLGAQQNIIGLQNQMGSQQQQEQQNIINQGIQNYATAQQYPQQQLAFMNAQLRGLPLQTSTVQGYQAAPSPINQLAGLAGTTIAGAKLAGYKQGGIAREKKFDVGGSVEHDLYQMPTPYLTQEVKTTPSPTIKNTGSAILTQRRMGTEPEPGYAPGGIVAFAEGGSKGKREAYEGESEDDDLINNIMMSGMSQGMMPNYTQMRQAPSRTNTPSGSTFEKAMQFVLPHEAGYVNHPNDKGGPTNRGVTQATLSGYLGRPATIDDVKNLDEQTARDIYKTKFFDPIASKLKDPKAQMVAFNAAIASGPGYANKLIAKHEGDPYAMWQEHTKYMTHDIPKANPSQNVFVKGWNNRQQDLLNAVKNNFAGGGEVQHFNGTDKSEIKDDSLLKSDGSGRYANKQIAEDAARYGKIGNYLKSIPEIVNPISSLINTGKGIINWGQTPVEEQAQNYYPELMAKKQQEKLDKEKNERIKKAGEMTDEEYAKYKGMNAFEDERNRIISGRTTQPPELDTTLTKTITPPIKPTGGIANALYGQEKVVNPPKELMGNNLPTSTTAPSTPAADRYSELMDMLKGQHKDIAKQKEQDKWMALLEGSLGTLAYTPKFGEVQTPFSGIAQGALKGVGAYAASNKQRAEENKDILGQMLSIQKGRGIEEYQKNHLLQSAMDRKATIDAQLQTANLSHLDRQDLLAERKRNDDIIASNQSSALQERMDARKDVNTRTARDDLRMMEDSYRRSLEKQYIDKNPLYHMDPKLKSSFDKDLQKLYEMPQYNDLRKQAYPNVDFSSIAAPQENKNLDLNKYLKK
jgi:hypothetical protein